MATHLDSIHPNARGASPDKQRLSVPGLGSRARGVLERQVILLKHAASRSGQAQRHHSRLLKRQRIGNLASHMFKQNRIVLEGIVGRFIDSLARSATVSDDAVSDLEAGDRRADLHDFARGVVAEDERIFDPAEHELAGHADLDPVHGVDGYGAVFDDEFGGPRAGIRRWVYCEGLLYACCPGCLICGLLGAHGEI